MTGKRPIVVVSNRGPVTFELADTGRPEPRRGAGGLVSGLGPLVTGTDTVWIAAAMSAGDRVVARGGAVVDAAGFRVRLLDLDPSTFAIHYDQVCNSALWFAHHGLFSPVTTPAWPPGWVDDVWSAYRRINDDFAAAVIATAPAGAVVLVQDYHLCLLAEPVRAARPDVAIVHFSHTPFAPPAWLRMLPDRVRLDLLAGLTAHDACGFHTDRWADDFAASVRDGGLDAPRTFVAPLGPDPGDLARTLASPACRSIAADLDVAIGDRAFLVRVDRLELSKNVARGFDAYAALLADRPDLRERVVFGAYLYPSRAGVAEYDQYRQLVEERVAAVNGRFGTASWTPIVYDAHDDYPRSIAALARADVVLVNPIRDGLNLVAKEAILVNERDGQLVLSPEAGAWEELGRHAWRAHPFDVAATAAALAAAIDVPAPERARRHLGLREGALASSPTTWLAAQLAAAGA